MPMPEGFDFVAHPQTYFNQTLREAGVRDQQHLADLHMSFIKICGQVKTQNKDKEEKRGGSAMSERAVFRIPYSVIAFCANRIKELENDP